MKSIWTYSHLLAPLKESSKLTLGEGHTPLIRAGNIAASLGIRNLYLKLEITNPSGSYKDRFAAVAVSDLVDRGVPLCLATSSGNTGSALAAYCAKAGIPCFVAIVDGAPLGKLEQMHAYGAQTLMIKGFGKDAAITQEVIEKLNKLASAHQSVVQISAYCFSPLGMEGVQTIAYEIAGSLPAVGAAELGGGLHVFCPAGGGGLTLAVAKGFFTWQQSHPQFALPKIHCVQPEGNNTISGPLRDGGVKAKPMEQSHTLISGLQVPNILDGNQVISACRLSGGNGYSVKDELVYKYQRALARQEGIFCEPAAATALAGLKMAVDNGELGPNDDAVCLITGHGFKDPVAARRLIAPSAAHYFEKINDSFDYLNTAIIPK